MAYYLKAALKTIWKKTGHDGAEGSTALVLPPWGNADLVLPFLGSGAGIAIEGGVVLARCLAAFAGAEALTRYEGARLARAAAAQRGSSPRGEMFALARDEKSASGSPFINPTPFAYDPVTAPL